MRYDSSQPDSIVLSQASVVVASPTKRTRDPVLASSTRKRARVDFVDREADDDVGENIEDTDGEDEEVMIETSQDRAFIDNSEDLV